MLPIGKQSFHGIRTANMLYVDKTKAMFNLISRSTINFLARPRRFGKSLLCSTLKHFYKGERALFKDLWIDENTAVLGLKWEEYPVLHLDMSTYKNTSGKDFLGELNRDLLRVTKDYELSVSWSSGNEGYVRTLLRKLAHDYKKGVVVLIDEYDAPIVQNLGKELETKSTLIEDLRHVLQTFYSMLKASDEYIHFLLLTGVSKFSKMNVFSGLNNLNDISHDIEYADLLGYTQAELETNFSDYLKDCANYFKIDPEELLNEIKYWYNGYQFSDLDVKVYNPFSTLSFFEKRKFRNYWFETGGTSSLTNLLLKKQYAFKNLALVEREADVFQGFDIEHMEVENLLYFSGYLTIKRVERRSLTDYLYTLSFPNVEVQKSFAERFLVQTTEANYTSKIANGLHKNLVQGDMEALKQNLQDFIRIIPYVLHRGKEVFYQSMLYALFLVTGFNISAEEYTNIGRIDLLCKLPKQIYIFELKLNQSAQAALEQIKAKEYYAKYLTLYPDKAIYLVGINIKTQLNNIDELAVEQIR